MNTRARKNRLSADTQASNAKRKSQDPKTVKLEELKHSKGKQSVSGSASARLTAKTKNLRSTVSALRGKNKLRKNKNVSSGGTKREFRDKTPAQRQTVTKSWRLNQYKKSQTSLKPKVGKEKVDVKSEPKDEKKDTKISENIKSKTLADSLDACDVKNGVEQLEESGIVVMRYELVEPNVEDQQEKKLICANEDADNDFNEIIVSVEEVLENPSHHECSYCDRKFLYRKNLRAHMKTKHTDIFDALFRRNIDKSNYIACQYCDRKFKYHKNMKAHVREKHPEKVVKKNADELLYACSLCLRKFKHKKNLVAHIRQKHTNQNELSIAGMMKIYGPECKFCGLKFVFKKSLTNHIRNDHAPDESKKTAEEPADQGPFFCNECSRVFIYKRNLNAHIRLKHSMDVKMPLISLYKCSKCDETFQRIVSLKKHTRLVHSVRPPVSSCSTQSPKTCPLCGYQAPHRITLLNHFTSVHNLEIQVNHLEFENVNSFEQWKDEIENETKCRYNKISHKLYPGRETSIYQCHRSGHYRARGSGCRLLKAQGSKKLNAYCPAQLHVTTYGDCIRVRFTSTHVGHENELCHVHLKQRDREIIAQKLALGIPPEDIIAEAGEIDDPNRRESYIDLKDVYNVQASFKLKVPERDDERELLSLDEWICQHQKDVLLYEKVGSSKLIEMGLESDDFLLILMNDLQQELLCKFGGNIVCVQTIRNPSKFAFMLTTIMILDEYCESFPVAFLFSNRVNEDICRIFFQQVANCVGPIQPNVFMSDKSTDLYKAWVDTMLPAHRQLFCAWHVLRDWKNNALRIANEEKRKQVLKMLEVEVLKQIDYPCFEEALNKFLECSDQDVQGFLEFFVENYLETIPSWAYCFRLDAQINTNLSAETFYRVLRYVTTKDSSKLVSVEEALYSLTKHMEYKKRCRKVTSMKRFKNSKKISTIRKNHKSALNVKIDEKVITVIEDGWLIPSFNNVKDELCEMFTVRKNPDPSCVDCKLVCPSCNVCIHTYSCSCLDYSIRFTMCEHIHYLCNVLKTKVEIEEVGESTYDYDDLDFTNACALAPLTPVSASECERESVEWKNEPDTKYESLSKSSDFLNEKTPVLESFDQVESRLYVLHEHS